MKSDAEYKRNQRLRDKLLLEDIGFNSIEGVMRAIRGLDEHGQKQLQAILCRRNDTDTNMASENLDILVSVGGLVYELESAANENGATIYNICHRDVGWAIQWHEEKKQGESENWKDGLVIYRYYKTLEAMAKGEFLRLGESSALHAPDAAKSAAESS